MNLIQNLDGRLKKLIDTIEYTTARDALTSPKSQV
jgi:hypothetical protein